MPKIRVNDISMNYEQQGAGEPLVLIPFLSADNACYAFQVAEYSKHFTCVSIDPRDAGESDKPAGSYTTEQLADDVAGLMQALNIERAHVAGLSLGAATAMWLSAKHPDRVKSLSLHSCWTKTDLYLRTVVQGWQLVAKASDDVTDTLVGSIFPWCLTPDLYAQKPEHIETLAAFVRSRPKQPVTSFIRQCDAVIAHDAESQLNRITAPTQITFGARDAVTSMRFAEQLTGNIAGAELAVFEDCSHAPIYENVTDFNERTLDFLLRNSG